MTTSLEFQSIAGFLTPRRLKTKKITARTWKRKSLVLHKRTLLVLFVQVTPSTVPGFEGPVQIHCHFLLLSKVLSQHMPLTLKKQKTKHMV